LIAEYAVNHYKSSVQDFTYPRVRIEAAIAIPTRVYGQRADPSQLSDKGSTSLI